MKKSTKIIMAAIAALIALTAVFAIIHSAARTEVPDGALLVSCGDEHELKLEYIDGVTFTELLESQERAESVDFAPWEKLVKWLCMFDKEAGLAPGDCNLRNFILDTRGQVCGIDFEQCGESANTSVKHLLDQIGFAVCEFPDANSVRNCNTPDEYNKLCADTIDCTEAK